MRSRAQAIPRVLALPLITLLLASCASDEASSGEPLATEAPTSLAATTLATTTVAIASAPVTTSAAATTTTTTATTTSAPTTTTTEPADDVVRIDVAVAGGVVTTDDERVDVTKDATVELTVVADVADEIHVHGYDLFADTTPATPVIVTFRADIPGLFEIELEDARLLLVELLVS